MMSDSQMLRKLFLMNNRKFQRNCRALCPKILKYNNNCRINLLASMIPRDYLIPVWQRSKAERRIFLIKQVQGYRSSICSSSSSRCNCQLLNKQLISRRQWLIRLMRLSQRGCLERMKGCRRINWIMNRCLDKSSEKNSSGFCNRMDNQRILIKMDSNCSTTRIRRRRMGQFLQHQGRCVSAAQEMIMEKQINNNNEKNNNLNKEQQLYHL